MASERIQRRIDSLLDEADQAIANEDWTTVASRARAVLRLDSENDDALAYLAAAESDPGSPEPAPSNAAPRPLPGQTIPGRGRQEEGLSGPRHATGPRSRLRPN